MVFGESNFSILIRGHNILTFHCIVNNKHKHEESYLYFV